MEHDIYRTYLYWQLQGIVLGDTFMPEAICWLDCTVQLVNQNVIIDTGMHFLAFFCINIPSVARIDCKKHNIYCNILYLTLVIVSVIIEKTICI